MTDPNNNMPTKAVVETKVTAAALGSLVAGLGLALLNAVQADNSILGGLNPILQFIILAMVPTLITFAAGYYAPHTSR